MGWDGDGMGSLFLFFLTFFIGRLFLLMLFFSGQLKIENAGFGFLLLGPIENPWRLSVCEKKRLNDRPCGCGQAWLSQWAQHSNNGCKRGQDGRRQLVPGLLRHLRWFVILLGFFFLHTSPIYHFVVLFISPVLCAQCTHTVSEEAYKNAVAAFKKIAGSTKKEMSRKQFTKTLTQKYPPEFADLIFNTFDTDGNGTMSVCPPSFSHASSLWHSLPFPSSSPTLVSINHTHTAERVLGVHGPLERRLGGAEAAGLVHAL